MIARLAVGSTLVLGVLALASAGPAPNLRGSQAPASPPAGSPGERVVISVGEERITAAGVEKIIQALPPQYRAFYSGPGKSVLPQYLVRMKILTAEARKQNLEGQPDVRQAIQLATESILAEAARRHIVEGIPVPEEELRELYARQREDLEEVRIRRLLIRTVGSLLSAGPNPNQPPLSPEEAQKKIEELRQQILAGADFAELAQEHSEELATAGAGGDMGYVNRQKVVPPVAEAAYRLAPGQVSEVILTPYGLELIQVEDKRVKPLEEVRSELEGQIRQEKFEEVLRELAEHYKVVVDTNFFSPQAQTPGPADPASPR